MLIFKFKDVVKLTLAYENMGEVRRMICLYYYHDESSVGGINICYYDINLVVKNF
jgi:hypothetical protein